jgi:hypothetical protein
MYARINLVKLWQIEWVLCSLFSSSPQLSDAHTVRPANGPAHLEVRRTGLGYLPKMFLTRGHSSSAHSCPLLVIDLLEHPISN